MPTSLNEFLNAKTSVAFGASAAMVVAFTATLCSAFPLPTALVGLSLSALFAAAQVAPLKDRIAIKAAFWAICTMVIFHAARGGNATVGEAVGSRDAAMPTEMIVPDGNAGFSPIDVLVPSAYAGDADKQADKQADNRYYLWKVDERGNGVYTNSAGAVRTNAVARQAFAPWQWKK
jgi:hypothetical protein